MLPIYQVYYQDKEIDMIHFPIYIDDSVREIKRKIREAMGGTFSLEEMYVYCEQDVDLDSVDVFTHLSTNKSLVKPFLVNIGIDYNGDDINFDDVLSWNLEAKSWVLKKPVGFQDIWVPFVSDPTSNEGVGISNRVVAGLNNNLVLTTGEIRGDRMKLCLVEELGDSNRLLPLYFPGYNKKRQENREKRTKDKIALFYSLYKERNSELAYETAGLTSFECVIKAVQPSIIPLSLLFKVIHATKNHPFVKWNPKHSKQENMYRFYTNGVTKDGRKIPAMNRGDIFKYTRSVGKALNTLTVFVESANLFCEFESSGDVRLSCFLEKPMMPDEIDDRIREAIQPVFASIRPFLEQIGHEVPIFHSLSQSEIVFLQYETSVFVEAPLDLASLMGCLSCLFVLESQTEKSYVLRYKRVANFNVSTSQEAYVIEQTKSKNGLRGEELITGLMTNYDMTDTEARQLLARMATEIELERSAGHREVEIKTNPGFKTVVTLDPVGSRVIISIDKIDNLDYLKLIPLYLDSMIRLTQEREKFACFREKEEYQEEDEDEEEDEEEEETKKEGDKVEYADFNNYRQHEEEEAKIRNAMELFFDEEVEDDEDQNEDKDEMIEGGAKKKIVSSSSFSRASTNQNQFRNIDGLKLGNPNPFQQRLEELDPILFNHPRQVNDPFTFYSRSCMHSARRQPVILTEEEIQQIDQEQPGFLSRGLSNGDILAYRSFYYLCPRYWCMKTNRPLSEEDIKTGKCGKLIKRTDKIVKPGHYVFQFYDKGEHGSEDNYMKHYPGFIDGEKHPDGLCMPCCFKNWDTVNQLERRNQCLKMDKRASANKKENVDYIYGPEKFPMDALRWGYLPFALQPFFKQTVLDCQSKRNQPCFMRHGVEKSRNQSFVACIADALFFGHEKIPSLAEMKEILIEAMDLDIFLTLQNGNLLALFSPEDLVVNDSEKNKEKRFHETASKAFAAFQRFLRDDQVVVDYTYLWDLVCRPNPRLFAKGINLVIMEIVHRDVTANVEWVCPSNHYSSEMYVSTRPTLVLIKEEIKENGYYEPIYLYWNRGGGNVHITKTYLENDKDVPVVWRQWLMDVWGPLMRRGECGVKSRIQNEYRFRSPLKLQECAEALRTIGKPVLKQVRNYQGKVILLVVDGGVIPCYPSAFDPVVGKSVVFMNDESMYRPYNETVAFLQDVASRTNIPCKPVFRIIEDEMIVGVLTESNQFVMVSEPVAASLVYDSLQDVRSGNYLAVDIATQNVDTDDVDKERVEYIDKIRSETKSYQHFRNEIRKRMNEYDYLKTREKIEKEIASKILYNRKWKAVQKILRSMLDDSELRKNPAYFQRMADEMIRYPQVYAYIFEPQKFMVLGDIPYEINDDEILLSQSILTQEYFDGLISATPNPYVHKQVYDTAQPNYLFENRKTIVRKKGEKMMLV